MIMLIIIVVILSLPFLQLLSLKQNIKIKIIIHLHLETQNTSPVDNLGGKKAPVVMGGYHFCLRVFSFNNRPLLDRQVVLYNYS